MIDPVKPFSDTEQLCRVVLASLDQSRNTLIDAKSTTSLKRRAHIIDSSSSSDASIVPKYKTSKRVPGGRYKRQRRVSLSRIEHAQRRCARLNSHCLDDLDTDLSIIDVIATNTEYTSMSPHDRKTWLLNQCLSRGSGQRRFAVTFGGDSHDVCNQCFADWYGLGLRTLQRMLKQRKNGVVRVVAAPTLSNDSVLKHESVEWISFTYLHFGDFMPDECTVCMPVYSRKELWIWYSHSDTLDAFYGLQAFCNLLRVDFTFIRFRRHKKFAQCDYCNELDALIAAEKVLPCSIVLRSDFCLFILCPSSVFFVLPHSISFYRILHLLN